LRVVLITIATRRGRSVGKIAKDIVMITPFPTKARTPEWRMDDTNPEQGIRIPINAEVSGSSEFGQAATGISP
jgi:hypothetical protein